MILYDTDIPNNLQVAFRSTAQLLLECFELRIDSEFAPELSLNIDFLTCELGTPDA